MIHDLKILSDFFVAVLIGEKTFEVRKDDRPFDVGDILKLHEINCGVLTGREIDVEVTYILRDPAYVKDGYCILGIQRYGKWEEISEYNGWGDTHYRCSVCGEEWYLEAGKPKENNMNFCPRCSARLDGDN